jgi:hypothetical protein
MANGSASITSDAEPARPVPPAELARNVGPGLRRHARWPLAGITRR